MRKAVIRKGDSIIEIDISDEEVKSLLGIQVPTQKITVDPKKESNNEAVVRDAKQQSTDYLESVLATSTEVRGRKEQSKYYIFRIKESGYLVGLARWKKHDRSFMLGLPDDPRSRIGIITRAVKALSKRESFTRRDLGESLPSSLSKGYILKFALDYLQHIGLILRLKEKDIATGAIAYRLNKSDRASLRTSGTEAAGVILK